MPPLPHGGDRAAVAPGSLVFETPDLDSSHSSRYAHAHMFCLYPSIIKCTSGSECAVVLGNYTTVAPEGAEPPAWTFLFGSESSE